MGTRLEHGPAFLESAHFLRGERLARRRVAARREDVGESLLDEPRELLGPDAQAEPFEGRGAEGHR